MRRKIKNKLGDMTLFGVIFAFVLVVIFSPVFLYIQSRQAITVANSMISSSVEKYSESLFRSVYDEAKSTSSGGNIYSSLTKDLDIHNGLASKILVNAGFTSQNSEKNIIYSSEDNVDIINPVININKINKNKYQVKLSYKMEVPLSILGTTYYTYSNNYSSISNIYRHEDYQKGLNSNNKESYDYKNNYIWKIDVSEKQTADLFLYYCECDDGTYNAYLDGDSNATTISLKTGQQNQMTMYIATSGDDETCKISIYLDKDKKTSSLFNGYTCPSSVYINGSVTNIGDNFFRYINGIKNVYIYTNDLTKIGDYAFSGCDLSNCNLVLNDGLETIGKYAFFGTNIKYIELPGTVKYIGDDAFNNSKAITTNLSYTGTIDAFRNVNYYCTFKPDFNYVAPLFFSENLNLVFGPGFVVEDSGTDENKVKAIVKCCDGDFYIDKENKSLEYPLFNSSEKNKTVFSFSHNSDGNINLKLTRGSACNKKIYSAHFTIKYDYNKFTYSNYTIANEQYDVKLKESNGLLTFDISNINLSENASNTILTLNFGGTLSSGDIDFSYKDYSSSNFLTENFEKVDCAFNEVFN